MLTGSYSYKILVNRGVNKVVAFTDLLVEIFTNIDPKLHNTNWLRVFPLHDVPPLISLRQSLVSISIPQLIADSLDRFHHHQIHTFMTLLLMTFTAIIVSKLFLCI